ncbi:unnamed protein product, partial [Gulo gulo]
MPSAAEMMPWALGSRESAPCLWRHPSCDEMQLMEQSGACSSSIGGKGEIFSVSH